MGGQWEEATWPLPGPDEKEGLKGQAAPALGSGSRREPGASGREVPPAPQVWISAAFVREMPFPGPGRADASVGLGPASSHVCAVCPAHGDQRRHTCVPLENTGVSVYPGGVLLWSWGLAVFFQLLCASLLCSHLNSNCGNLLSNCGNYSQIMLDRTAQNLVLYPNLTHTFLVFRFLF